MNNSTKFKIAHKITKATIRKGDSYSATFAQSLKIANSLSEDSVFLNEKVIFETFAVVKCSDHIAKNGWKHEMSKDLGDGYYVIKFGKGNRHIVENELRKDAEKQAAVKTETTNWSERRIESLAYAQMMNLNHGKAWFCSERDVELKGANPAFEGELICYVYA